VPAAIYAALVSGILRSHAPMEPGAAEMLSAINLSLAERRIEAQFVSIICAVWDDQRRTLLLANSGLPRPVFCRTGTCRLLRQQACRSASLKKRTTTSYVPSKAGDLFVFFSDGILDATGRKANCSGVKAWKPLSPGRREIGGASCGGDYGGSRGLFSLGMLSTMRR